jgi:hypothetical protein
MNGHRKFKINFGPRLLKQVMHASVVLCINIFFYPLHFKLNGPITYKNQNFDLDKSRQKFHHSLKEHHKISNTPFRCEML